jgi:copper(I)-binding protein
MENITSHYTFLTTPIATLPTRNNFVLLYNSMTNDDTMDIDVPFENGNEMDIDVPFENGNEMDIDVPFENGNEMDIDVPFENGNEMDIDVPSENGDDIIMEDSDTMDIAEIHNLTSTFAPMDVM